ncbi:hypothetical protein FGO68_gene10955 [Halteria grandinella]|uniref:Uncharacterized protein n=1 Tax=Halteria grandinella TaxID=5974 RepID=A0A8J8T5T7_HALGN|nr:hypothetical protein FGO68_gene10955 [Halteria grandinella]
MVRRCGWGCESRPQKRQGNRGHLLEREISSPFPPLKASWWRLADNLCFQESDNGSFVYDQQDSSNWSFLILLTRKTKHDYIYIYQVASQQIIDLDEYYQQREGLRGKKFGETHDDQI